MILNFGSANIDFVYTLDHIVGEGETIDSQNLEQFCGGKGLNQSIALSRAGAKVCHVGAVGMDGNILIDLLNENGVDIRYMHVLSERTGHAVIQLSQTGDNSIILYGGANHKLTSAIVDAALQPFPPDTIVLLQNETNLVSYIIDKAYAKGMRIALNPSPMNRQVLECDLRKISVFLFNEIEGRQITGADGCEDILAEMAGRFPDAVTVLTLGKRGVACYHHGHVRRHGIYDVPVIDSTAAGDAFTGFFLAAYSRGDSIESALEQASKASSLTVMSKGAANSIPTLRQVETTQIKPVMG